jgi:hypothetical protein
MDPEIVPIPPEFQQGARYFRDLADAFHPYSTVADTFERPGSIAAADSVDQRYDNAWGRATFEVAHEYAPHTNVVYDHLNAMAAVVEAPNTVLAVSSICRTVLEALAITSWLYEPGIDVRERVRRRYNVRLASLGEQMNILNGVSGVVPSDGGSRTAREEVAQRILDIKACAPRYGFDYMFQRKVRFRGVQRERYLERRLPSNRRLISDMFESFAPSSGGRLGRVVHQLTSANAHGQNHGALFFIVESRSSSIHAGVADVQMGLGLSFFSSLFSAVITGSWVASARLCEYFGWSDAPWQAVLRPAAETWSEWQAMTSETTTGPA